MVGNKSAEWLARLNYDIPFYLFILSSILLLIGSYFRPYIHTEESKKNDLESVFLTS